MHKLRTFFFVCGGIFLLALSYIKGAVLQRSSAFGPDGSLSRLLAARMWPRRPKRAAIPQGSLLKEGV